MTHRITNTGKQKQILNALGVVKDDTIEYLVVKVYRGKQIVDAGDCYVVESDKNDTIESK